MKKFICILLFLSINGFSQRILKRDLQGPEKNEEQLKVAPSPGPNKQPEIDDDLLAQKKKRDEIIKKIFEDAESGLDRESLDELMKPFFKNDFFNNQNWAQDLENQMQELLKEAHKATQGNLIDVDGPQLTWSEKKGKKILEIIPPGQGDFDVKVTSGRVTLSGKIEKKTETSSSVSHFTRSFSLPYDVDESKVKIDQKPGKITLTFPIRKAANSSPGKQRPVNLPGKTI